jgi:transposase-like protein
VSNRTKTAKSAATRRVRADTTPKSEIAVKRPHARYLPPGKGARRPDKAELVIAGLLRGQRLVDVAVEIGMGASTLRDWMHADWFREQYSAARQQLLEGTINKLRSAGNDAVNLLHQVILNPKLAATPRVSAARGLLELLLRAVEVQDLAVRLERLEATMKTEDK